MTTAQLSKLFIKALVLNVEEIKTEQDAHRFFIALSIKERGLVVKMFVKYLDLA